MRAKARRSLPFCCRICTSSSMSSSEPSPRMALTSNSSNRCLIRSNANVYDPRTHSVERLRTLGRQVHLSSPTLKRVRQIRRGRGSVHRAL